MKYLELPGVPRPASNIILGLMRISDKTDDEIRTLYGPARQAGIVPGDITYFDFSYDTLVTEAEKSLQALETDYIDIFLLHRPDALVEPEEVARAFDHLESSGKVRAFGVSNQTPRQMELLRKYVKQPLIVNQMQLSITDRKSTRLNSSHVATSYAVFCLKKK